ncbi:MAG: enoyl-CoA hydratase [Bordetella sp. SCN 68-11]|nr:enoyl-CoA hydratase/isomerase family protein [Rhodospirillales bacterium]ODU86967.1 MAG: enoyl-CoA hydratase [Bordetella sp. SCN 68-11]OJY74270.1 MAG: enoyl-CoA hydratase [Rhodospirillales bacterium 70-18]
MTPPDLVDSQLELDGRIAILTLNRNDVRNELTGTHLADEIVAVVDWINAHEGISALVLTGTGAAFSAGGNVKHMQNRDSGSFAGDVYTVQNRYRAGIQRMALAMHRLEVPAIAAVNGAAVGAGCDLACMCDVRLAATTARIGETFVNLGIIPGDGGGWFLQRLVGYQRAAEMSFSGRLLDAAEAKAIGLFLEVVEPDELLARAREMAAGFAAKPPRSVRLTKRLLKSAQKMELAEHLELAAMVQGMCHQTEDHAEAVAAFLEKRSPVYRGT